MYLIANVSGKEIVIADLGVSIKPKQALNLHKINTTISPESSRDLNSAKKLGYIKVLKKDEKIEKEKVDIQPDKSLDQEALINSLKDILREEMKSQLAEKKQDNSDVLLALGKIAELVKEKGPTVINNITQSGENKNSPEKEEESGVDEDTMSQIHAKAVSKITKESNTSVDYSSEEIIDSSLSKNISELEDLL